MRTILFCIASALADPCGMATTDPKYEAFVANQTKHVKGWVEVNLDLPPEERWAEIVAPLKEEIKELIDTFKSIVGKISKDLFAIIELLFKQKIEKLVEAMPAEYGAEIVGIAKATGLPVADIFVYNIAYEIEGACTSLVAQDDQGRLIHGRNLDFGLFMGWDKVDRQWTLTEKLRPLLRHVRFTQGGATIYNATVFAGYIGLLTGMKQNAFSITVNTRFDGNLWKGLRDWISGADRTGSFMSFVTRDAVMQDATYAQALHRLNTTKLLGPAYLIIGGVNSGEGAIVTRTANESLHLQELSTHLSMGKQYILQTNYDNWQKAPFFDDRRTPGQHCMDTAQEMGAIGFKGVFQVLSAIPTRNRLTTYTTLMSTHDGRMESYEQYCYESHCALWAAEEATLV